MNRSIHRIATRVSVRTRVIALAVIPVIGFLVNGIVFMIGKTEVARALRTVERASDLADVSREFGGALAAMRFRTHEFAARPSRDLIKSFEATHALAVRTLGIIETAVDETTRQNLAPMKARLAEVALRFSDLARGQEILGFTASEGTRDRMPKPRPWWNASSMKTSPG